MRRLTPALIPAAVLAAYALAGASPAVAAPAPWVTAAECVSGGGKIAAVGPGQAVCHGGRHADDLVRPDDKKSGGGPLGGGGALGGGSGGGPLGGGGPTALLGGLLGGIKGPLG